MKHILVTGGCGFIGSNFIKYMLDKYPNYFITNIDNRTYAGKGKNLEHMNIEGLSNYLSIIGDICDPEIIEEYVDYNHLIINFAAESHVDRSLDDGSEFARTNFLGVQTILDAIVKETKKGSKKRFLQVSTDEVYGSISDGKFKETDKLNPGNPYSANKAGADLLVLSYVNSYGINAVITRSSTNFGPYQFPEKFIPKAIINLLEGEKIPLYGDGLQIRNWIYVNDDCRGIDLVLHKGNAGEVYNIGSEFECTNIGICDRILNEFGKTRENSIKKVNDRRGHDRRYAVDTSKIKALGWKEDRNFDAALKETIDWYKNNKDWWEGLKE